MKCRLAAPNKWPASPRKGFMKILTSTLLAILVAISTVAPAHAQIVEKKSLNLDGAKKAIAAAVDYAKKNNAPGGVIAIVDEGGNLMALERLDGSFAMGATISIGKARTAVLFKKPTRFFEELINKGRTAMTVSDMDRAVEFYSALTFRKISDVEVLGEEFEHLEGVFGARMRIVRMQLGNEYLDLTQYLAPPGRPIPVDSRSNDLWFQHIAIVVRDMDQAFDKLRALKVQFVSTGPQTLPPSIKAAAGIKAFYFRDPDQHNLEIIYFPPGKGDPRWQEKTDNLFLGIDHTAIGISNTDSSLKFYRDLLGLRKAGESENFGTEQEHLNQVFGAHLHITGMRSDAGPGIEFLEYLTPRDGRPRPADVRANDIVHWQTTIATDDVEALAKKLRDAHVGFVSTGIIVLPNDKSGFSKGTLVSDPDGHDLLLIQK